MKHKMICFAIRLENDLGESNVTHKDVVSKRANIRCQD
jgi:hypothetical protein